MTPEQIETFMYAAGASAVYVLMLLGIEAYAAWKRKPLITHAMRAAVRRVPWLFVLLAMTFGFMAGHCFGQ